MNDTFLCRLLGAMPAGACAAFAGGLAVFGAYLAASGGEIFYAGLLWAGAVLALLLLWCSAPWRAARRRQNWLFCAALLAVMAAEVFLWPWLVKYSEYRDENMCDYFQRTQGGEVPPSEGVLSLP